MKVIGLTGGIATGKSTVSELLKKKCKNIVIIDADSIGHRALQVGEEPYNNIVKFFHKEKGYDIFQAPSADQPNVDTKAIDRAKLGKIIFDNPALRSKLNSFTHTWIIKTIVFAMLREFSLSEFLLSSLTLPFGGKNADEKIVILDVPLLFETKYLTYLTSKNVVVYAPDPLQLERLMKRNNLSKEDAEARIKAQFSMDQKLKMSDIVIDNSGDLQQLEKNVEKAVEQMKSKAWSFATQGALTAVATAAAGVAAYVVKSKL